MIRYANTMYRHDKNRIRPITVYFAITGDQVTELWSMFSLATANLILLFTQIKRENDFQKFTCYVLQYLAKACVY